MKTTQWHYCCTPHYPPSQKKLARPELVNQFNVHTYQKSQCFKKKYIYIYNKQIHNLPTIQMENLMTTTSVMDTEKKDTVSNRITCCQILNNISQITW